MGLLKVNSVPSVDGRSKTADLRTLASFVVEDQLKQKHPLTMETVSYVSRGINATYHIYPGVPRTFEELEKVKAWKGYCEALYAAVPGYLHDLIDAQKR